MSDEDVNNYNKIKTDLDKLRLLVEQSELWIYKKKENKADNSATTSTSTTNAATKQAPADTSGDNNVSMVIVSSSSAAAAATSVNASLSLLSTTSTTPTAAAVSKRSPPLTPFTPHTSASSLNGDPFVLQELEESGPELDAATINKYKELYKILHGMIRLCVKEVRTTSSDNNSSNNSSNSNNNMTRHPRRNDQRLLRNMGVHNIVLDLTKITYEKADDKRMRIIMRTAHEFLQAFCFGNKQNQALLHEKIDMSLLPANEWEAKTATHIFKDNSVLCNEANERLVQNFIHALEHQNADEESKIAYLEFLQTICLCDGHELKKVCQKIDWPSF